MFMTILPSRPRVRELTLSLVASSRFSFCSLDLRSDIIRSGEYLPELTYWGLLNGIIDNEEEKITFYFHLIILKHFILRPFLFTQLKPLRLLGAEDDVDHHGGREEVEECEGRRCCCSFSLTDDKADVGDKTGRQEEVAVLEDSPANTH